MGLCSSLTLGGLQWRPSAVHAAHPEYQQRDRGEREPLPPVTCSSYVKQVVHGIIPVVWGRRGSTGGVATVVAGRGAGNRLVNQPAKQLTDNTQYALAA